MKAILNVKDLRLDFVEHFYLLVEIALERSVGKLLLVASGVAMAHAVLLRLSRTPAESEEEMEGYDGEFQLLNLAER